MNQDVDAFLTQHYGSYCHIADQGTPFTNCLQEKACYNIWKYTFSALASLSIPPLTHLCPDRK